MKITIAALVLCGCMPPLHPGQTRCTSGTQWGKQVTDCESYVPPPIAPAADMDGDPAPTPVFTSDKPDRNPQQIPVTSEPDPDQPAPVSAPPRVIVHGDPLACTLTSATSGRCFKSVEQCDAFRQTAGGSYGECVQREAAGCFNYHVTLTDKKMYQCAPSLADCEHQLADAKLDMDNTVTATQCGIYRQ